MLGQVGGGLKVDLTTGTTIHGLGYTSLTWGPTFTFPLSPRLAIDVGLTLTTLFVPAVTYDGTRFDFLVGGYGQYGSADEANAD